MNASFHERPSLYLTRLTFAFALLAMAPLYILALARSLTRFHFFTTELLCGYFLIPTFLAAWYVFKSGDGQISRLGFLTGVTACLGPGVVLAAYVGEQTLSGMTGFGLPYCALSVASLLACSVGALRFEQWYRLRERPLVSEQRMMQWSALFLLLAAVIGFQNDELTRSVNTTLFFGMLLPVSLLLLSGSRIAQAFVYCCLAFLAALASIPLICGAAVNLLQHQESFECVANLALAVSVWGLGSACLSLAFRPARVEAAETTETMPRTETLWSCWET